MQNVKLRFYAFFNRIKKELDIIKVKKNKKFNWRRQPIKNYNYLTLGGPLHLPQMSSYLITTNVFSNSHIKIKPFTH